MRFVIRRLIVTSLVALAVQPALAHAQDRSSLRAHSGWARASVPAQKVAMVYFSLENPGPNDRLIGASTSVADAVGIHEFTTDEGGNRMQDVDSVQVPAASRRDFDRDCYHLMLTGLKRPLRAGETVKVALRFERAGTIELPVTIRSRDDVAGARDRSAR